VHGSVRSTAFAIYVQPYFAANMRSRLPQRPTTDIGSWAGKVSNSAGEWLGGMYSTHFHVLVSSASALFRNQVFGQF
jgi:hypothetical protein